MHEKKKYILLACLFGLFLFCAGTACGYFITRGSTEDYERASEYEAIIADIEGSTQQLSEGIDKSLVGVQYAGDAIERSGNSVGRIRDSVDRITGNQITAGDAIHVIEEGICSIESIILNAEKKE